MFLGQHCYAIAVHVEGWSFSSQCLDLPLELSSLYKFFPTYPSIYRINHLIMHQISNWFRNDKSSQTINFVSKWSFRNE